ncbi:hypothetical protein R6Q59_028994 [Mikania micrantha]|uniref:DUF4228 domain-containing protein n=1 Tax=Mikania micrantha TaxID=192012 RepID=A0A5N6LX13_9ASTR|nr:hypothetical protein E3N88_39398 [Mikania micrantha]
MGNCQAVDNASFVLQTQNGRAERFYSPISAADIMKLHPGHYVALLLTTTYYSSPPSSTSDHHHHHRPSNNNHTNTNQRLRVTRIKLLRPTDDLVLGHAYRLITTQEVMKGLNAKKNIKLNNHKNSEPSELARISGKSTNCEAAATRSNQSAKSSHQMKKAYQHQATPANSKSSGSKPRGWHPSLNSISETSS